MRRRPSDCGTLLDFAEVQEWLRLGPRTDIGVREIPVEQVIGSAGRAHEFDGCFRPRTERLRGVLAQIRADQPDAADRPILVHQVDHAYFVVDGHKRMSLAIAEGRREIDAEVGRYATRYHLASGATMDAIRATELELRFREVTGLAAAVPGARFPVGDPDEYLELAESVKAHAWDLSRDHGELVDPVAAAGHWHETVFVEVLAVARRAGIDRLLASCSDAELFLIVRRGFGEPMDPGWQVPAAFEQHAAERLRAAKPGVVGEVVARVTGRRHSTPPILSPADLEPEPPATTSDRGAGQIAPGAGDSTAG